jgi:Spy/CpxP family protein refolding chaperone
MKIKNTVLFAVTALVISASASAIGPRGGCGGSPAGPPDVEQLQQRLELSDSQSDSLRQLFAEQHAKRQGLRSEMREQMQERLATILTPTQLEQMQAYRGCGRGARRGPGDGRQSRYGSCR